MENLNPLQTLSEITNTLIKTNKQYVDQDFPPNENPPFWENLHFIRILDLYKQQQQNHSANELKLFNGSINPDNLILNGLSNPYFITAINGLANQHPNNILRLFANNTLNKQGIQGIWLCVNGEWKLVVIDDYIITTQDEEGNIIPAFGLSKQGDYWITLLEKAYAKVHGSYENIKEGFTEYALNELTSAPYKTLFNEQDPQKVWNFIKTGIDNGFITAATHISENEYPGAPAYPIVDAKEIPLVNHNERLICIKNPWNTFQWDGDWSIASPKWTNDIKKLCNYDPSDHTKFWIPIKDFINMFEDISVVEMRNNYYYQSVQIDHSKNSSIQNYTVLRMHISESTHMSVSVIQKDERDFGSKLPLNYTYSYGRILIGRVTSNGLVYQCGTSDQARDMYCSDVFDEGVYIIAIEIHWTQNTHKKFNVGFYSQNQISVEGVPNADLLLIQKNLIKSAIEIAPPKDQTHDDYSSVEEPNASRITGLLHGLLYFYYTNQSSTNTKISEMVNVQGKNLRICPPFTNNNSFYVSVVPGGDILVIIKILSTNHTYQLSFNYSAQSSNDTDEFESSYGSSSINASTNANKYKYIDTISNKSVLTINDNYNQFIRNKEGPSKEEDLKNFLAKTTEPLTKINPESATNINQKNQIDIKPPLRYPPINIAYGQIFSRKIAFNNFTDQIKSIKIESSDSSIVFVKNEDHVINPHDKVDIRLRFIAPSDKGVHEVKINIINVETDIIEEILVFTISSSGSYLGEMKQQKK